MKIRIGTWWEALRASYWFVPALTSLAAIALVGLTTWLDGLVATHHVQLPPILYGGTADGARQLLSTLASAMMSVTSVVFSITIVALTLASNQFGPRLLRNFMKDTVSQWTLGIFIATFLYSLLVLSDVRGGDAAFVPQISVTCAQTLAVLSTGILIYFVHHISTLIQADQVVRAVHDEVCGAIDQLLPEKEAERPAPGEVREFRNRAELTMHAGDYVEGIDYDDAAGIATEHDAIVEFRCRPGDFVPRDGVVAIVHLDKTLDDELAAKFRRTVFFGATRTPTQDVEFGILQLAEIAVRSLSPGVNDPFTAVACVDRLGSALRGLCNRPYPPTHRSDERGNLRVISMTTDFSGHVNAAFNQIRQNARGSVAVYIRLLEAFSNIADATPDREKRGVLAAHADMVLRAAEHEVPERRDVDDVADAYRRLMKRLGSRV